MNSLQRLEAIATPFFRAYAAVLFCRSPRIGAWFALITCWSLHVALAGVIGLLAAWLWARLLTLTTPGEPHLVNGLLTGLFIGAFHDLDGNLFGWLVLIALFVCLLSHWLATWLWRAGKLPLMSLPFVLACWLVALLSQVENPAAMLPAALSGEADVVFCTWADNFFTALGWLLLTPYPWAGILLFAGLLVASRYLAFLATIGYVSGQMALLLFGRTETNVIGYNFMLAAMALGGTYAVPSRASFLMALVGGAMAGWFSVALGVVVYPYHLPLLTLPFLLTVYLWLGGLGSRIANRSPELTLDLPQPPEVSWERVRLAQVRGYLADSLPLLLPGYGEWRVSQSFDGSYTHRAPWQHALDFDIVVEQRNHQGSGQNQSDYFCFGVPLSAPMEGQVVQLRNDLPDVLPGETDVVNNWGNYILLRTVAGSHVLLAHLKQGSLRVRQGEWVAAGQPLAACGSSGRAPEPHLHLQVQTEAMLGSPTRPFHLINVLLHLPAGRHGGNSQTLPGEKQRGEFRLYHLPTHNEIISAAQRDEGLAAALHFQLGRTLSFRVGMRRGKKEEGRIYHLHNELTLLGQSRLVGTTGASVAYEETQMVLGCYDRQGGPDPLLDMWVLALGLTPLSAAADCWQDRPALSLLPLAAWQRLSAALLRPLGAECASHYCRNWDETVHGWRQQGTHCFRLLPGINWCAETEAWIAPGEGVLRLRLSFGGHRFEAERAEVTVPC